MASIDASASPRHDHGGWPAARAHAQRPWSRCRHLLRSPSSSPHTPAAPFQHRASDLAVRRLCTKQRRAWCQEVQKGVGATLSAFPGVIDHMNGPQIQRESVIGETGVMVLRLDMPIAGYRKGRPPSRRNVKKSSFLILLSTYDWRVCLGGSGKPSGVVRRPRPRLYGLVDGPDALGGARRKSPAGVKG